MSSLLWSFPFSIEIWGWAPPSLLGADTESDPAAHSPPPQGSVAGIACRAPSGCYATHQPGWGDVPGPPCFSPSLLFPGSQPAPPHQGALSVDKAPVWWLEGMQDSWGLDLCMPRELFQLPLILTTTLWFEEKGFLPDRRRN